MVVLQHPKSAVAGPFDRFDLQITYLAAVKNTKKILGDFLSFRRGKDFLLQLIWLLLWLWVPKKNSRCRWGLAKTLNWHLYLEESTRLGFSTIWIGQKVEADKIYFKD